MLGASWLLAACGNDDSAQHTHWLGAQSWSSRHFVYQARRGDTSVDAQVVDWLEANAKAIGVDYLGAELDARDPIHYFKYPSQDDFDRDAPCPDAALACTLAFSDGHVEVHSPLPVDGHELVHAYMASIGQPPLFLEEGIASAVTCDPESSVMDSAFPHFPLEGTRWRDLVTTDPELADGQAVSSSLITTWLVDRYGLPRFLDLYRRLGLSDGALEVDAAVVATYERSFDELWDEMTTASVRRPCLATTSCAVLDQAMPMAAAGHVVDALPEAALLTGPALSGQLDMPRGVHACSFENATSADVLWPTTTERAYAESAIFLPGKAGYVVKPGRRDIYAWNDGPVSAPGQTVQPLSIELQPSSCADASSIDLEQSTALQLWPRSDPYTLQLRASTGQLTRIDGVVSGKTEPFEVKVCTGCAAGVLHDCKVITESYTGVSPGVSDPWLEISWNPPEPNQILTLAFRF